MVRFLLRDGVKRMFKLTKTAVGPAQALAAKLTGYTKPEINRTPAEPQPYIPGRKPEAPSSVELTAIINKTQLI